MEIKAYAKINLTLDITGKRQDGYHTIESVMQAVSLYDIVRIERNQTDEAKLKCDKAYLPVDEKNTAFRAARHFGAFIGTPVGVDIEIIKRVPSRAGMGGGSADAAAVLHGLNRLYGTNLSRETLCEIGAKVGADVPFCVVGGTCKCSGIGDIVEQADPMPGCRLLICKPPVGMSTPRAYAMLDRYPLSGCLHTPNMLKALTNQNLGAVAGAVANRFDEVLRFQQVKEIKRIMKEAGALTAIMTGSGSAVYGIFREDADIAPCMDRLQGKGELFSARPVHTGFAVL